MDPTDLQDVKNWLAVILTREKIKILKNTYYNRGRMGLVLVLMMFTSITLLGLWEKKKSKKRFQEAVRNLRELEALTLTKAVKK